MVAPVVEDALSRALYLPQTKGGGWYHFWDGTVVEPGHHSNVSAPLLQIPLYAKRGSLLAIGPQVQYVNEKPDDPLEIRIYDGADAELTLYEDDGVSSLSAGAASTITFSWTEASSTLAISKYEGRDFPGRLTHRSFNVVRVRKGHGVGFLQSDTPDKVVLYQGRDTHVRIQRSTSDWWARDWWWR